VVYSIQTGKTGFEKAQGMPLFDYLARHPEDASLFSEAMVGFSSQEPPAVAAAYDFRPSRPLSMLAGQRETCWQPSSPARRTGGVLSIGRTWWPTHPRFLTQKV